MAQARPVHRILVLGELSAQRGTTGVLRLDDGGLGPALTALTGHRDFRGFRPEQVAAAAPQGPALLAARHAVERLQRLEIGLVDALQLVRAIDLPPRWLEIFSATLLAGASEAAGERGDASSPVLAGLDSLLEAVDVQARTSRDALETWIRSLGAERARSRLEAGGAAAALEIVDDALSSLVTPTLQSPAFRRLEAGWRGVRLLWDRLDRRHAEVDLHPAAFAEVADLLADEIVPAERDVPPERQLRQVLGLYALEPSQAGSLRAIAGALQPISAAFLASASPAWVEGALGGALAPLPPAVHLACNPFLLRLPYGASGEPVRAFAYEEPRAGEDDYLWGDPAIALVLARAARALGGAGGGTFADLPLRAYQGHGRSGLLPVREWLSEDRAASCVRAGLAPLVADLNADRARILEDGR